MQERKSGILLHITSLPGKYGIGTFGEESYKFIDFLVETKQTYWQILPLGHTGFGNSPYSSYSAFAGNPLLIDIDNLPVTNSTKLLAFKYKKTNFEKVKAINLPILHKIADEFLNSEINKSKYNSFKEKQSFWLYDYAFFMALKDFFNEKPLSGFDDNIKFREENTLNLFSDKLRNEIERNQVIQYFFFQQWYKLKSYANNKGVKIIGDIPFYVAGDSADVWVNPNIFMLNKNLNPIKVAGVPPDYFSETGQLWGNPVYDWVASKKTNYNWWKKRMEMNLEMFDIVRIDHFRAFSEFWAIPFGDKTAENGEWLKGPEKSFLDIILKNKEKIIAEDLGVISEGTKKILADYDLAGMKIMQFAFSSGASNSFLPHNYSKNCVVYTGTHDNDTTNGIFEDFKDYEIKFYREYSWSDSNRFAHNLVKLCFASTANTTIIPLQDILELGKEARMNTPGTIRNNWDWKFSFEDIKAKHKEFLKHITLTYGRN